MAIRHPSRHYIHYLLSKQFLDGKVRDERVHSLLRPGSAHVVLRLDELGLPVPQNTETLAVFRATIDQTKSKMVLPAGFNPRAPRPSATTSAYLQKWRIADAWTNDVYVKSCIAILENRADIRRSLEVLLLGPLHRSDIALALRKHYAMTEDEMNTRLVLTFEHYFWSPTLLDMREWLKFFTPEWYGGYCLDYVISLHAPRDERGAQTSLECGLRNGEGLASDHALATMQHQSFRLFLEASAGGGSLLSRAQALAAAYSVYRDTEEDLDRRRGGGSHILEELRKIHLDFDKTPVRKTLSPGVVIDVPAQETRNGQST